ncbi:MAG: IS66 family transposase, partial [Ardenticatenales bacterium]|nr:IS66 family transposase [Ardenticatenales bacterium]
MRYQVHKIPPQLLEVVEYQIHRLRCLACGHTTSGKPPPGVTSSRFGPRVHALVALLTGRLLLSKREVVEYFQMLYGDGPSAGT